MKFRLPELEDKGQIISYITEHYAHNEKNLSASFGLLSMNYDDWVKKIHENIYITDEKWGKSYTYLVFNDNEKLIGLVNIRYDLDKEVINKYGHIGYGVRPSERRKGYATKILAYAKEQAKNLGLNKVIVGCYKENIGSAKAIIKNGGKLIREVNNIKDLNGYYKINLIDQFYEIQL